MIQVELLTWEVTLIKSCLVYRSSELTEDRKQVYEKLAAHIGPIGYYDFDLIEASRIYLSLVDYCNSHEAIFGKVNQKAIRVADEFLDLIFRDIPIAEIRSAMDVVKEREGIYEAAYAAG